MAFFGLFGSKEKKQQLDAGLDRSRTSLFGKLTRAIAGKNTVDDEVLDALEETLVTSDVGVETTLKIIDRIQARVKRDSYLGTGELNGILRAEIAELMRDAAGSGEPFAVPGPKPYVIMVVGVNGVGKTTTIAKLGRLYQGLGKKVLFCAGDTFRAAGGAQLAEWGKRLGIPVIQGPEGADPAALAFDAAQARKARGLDLLFVDTAGRLHTKQGLMEELKKVKRAIAKADPGEPGEVWLVLDAVTGQNGLEQAKRFHEAVGLTGVIVTKLDGTAKGGVLVPIVRTLKVPIRFIGVGEGPDDLQPFDAEAFVEALLEA